MKKYIKYSLAIILFISLISLFSGLSGRTGSLFSTTTEPLPQINDTTPRYPVKKTQVTTYKDLDTNPPIDLKNPSNIKSSVDYDPKTGLYIFRTKVGDQDISTPFSMSSSEYMDYTLKQSMANYFRGRNSHSFDNKDDKEDFSLKDIKLNIGPAERIFGPGGVKVKTQGYVEASMGLKYAKIDNPKLAERNRSHTAFYFNQDIQMNVTASVGDKINFGMNYDTKALFDFDSKRIKLAYDSQAAGDEDGIIKRIEAGNVTMASTNSLINGGTALFGIASEMQFGKLRVNTVISQQESQVQTANSKGGVQTTKFEFDADKYDENRHYFLGHYFRDNYDKAMSKLPYIQSPINITQIEVWVTNKRGDFNQARNIIAFADLGEYRVIKNPKWLRGSPETPSNSSNDLYAQVTTTYAAARNINQVNTVFDGVIENGVDYEKVESARLLSTNEYFFNPKLGYLSLASSLQADEVLAVAYEYTMNGQTYQVGELSTDIVNTYDPSNTRSGALFVKMLKPVAFSPNAYTWDLMMKNVYNLGSNSIQKDHFRLNISYQSDTTGTFLDYIPEGNIRDTILLRVMNLDRLDPQGNPVRNGAGDGIFDFVEGYTVRAQTGRVYFPIIEPFGLHLEKRIGSPILAEKYVYQELYDSLRVIASQIAEKNKFRISGSFRSSASNNEIDLNATNIPQGSVRVMANGTLLIEGSDYIVDYVSGIVTIINQTLIDSNTPIDVTLEDRTFTMQRKTLLGLNLSYDVSKDFNVGATIMHLYERPLMIKPEIGDESVRNTLWGFNTAYRTESQWLTNLIDKIPFVNAKQPSQITFNGEFAHLIGGHYKNKVTGSYSFLDDFEAAQTTIDIKNPFAWSLASTPLDKSATALFPEAALSNNIDYGKNRAMLSWFMIDGIFTRRNSTLTPQHIKNDRDQLSNHFIREINIWELFPNRDVPFNESATIPALNLSFYPNERGPYNLDATNINTNGTLRDPKKRWAGITRKMEIRDFETANVEYIEFWLMDPFVYNDTATVKNTGGDLYINLGEISEDVLKDGRKFFENGLPVNGDPTAVDTTVWGKVPKRQSTVYAFDDNQGLDARKKQDVGLNGLSLEEEFEFPTYKNYLTEFRLNLNDETILEMDNNPFSPLRDPSGDKYHFYRGSDFDRDEVGILDRYKYFNGTEGNSPLARDGTEVYSTAARATPDVEDIDQDNTLNELESYFQYKIELRPERMNVGDSINRHIVDSRTVKVTLANGKEGEVTWYQFKVPVRQPDKVVGNIRDLTSIRFMRIFLTNFEQPTFLRFGTLQLVRGDWRPYDQSLNTGGKPSGTGTMDVITVNIEENSNRTPVSYVMPPGLERIIDPEQTQLIKENEQAIALRIKELNPGDARAIYKNTMHDLRRYKRIQMFTHAEELVNETTLGFGELTVFIRLGADYRNNYYEYEIPLVVTPPGSYNNNINNDRLIVWPVENMFDFPLDLLKDVKLNRNRARKQNGAISFTTLYSEYDPEKPNNKVSVMGNPSLAEVNVIMIGVRNNTRLDKSGEVWVNELRLTDFDERGGWAAQGNLNIALSDVGNISLSGRKETIGFGGLEQTLLQRRLDDFYMYNFASTVDLGRFIPEKAKVSIPFNYAYSNQTSTPEFDPFDQDVTLKEALSLVDTKAEKDSIKRIAQEKTTIKSIGLNNVKVNIQSKTPMPYDPANFSFGYMYSETEINNPTTVYDITKNYKVGLNYSYSPIVKTWEPFRKTTSKSGAAKFAKSMGFNYMPSNITFNSNIIRYYTETQLRDIDNYVIGGANNRGFLTWSQSFLWNRDFSINWDFTRNLKFTFQSGTQAEIEEEFLQVNKKLNRSEYDKWKEAVMRSIKDLGDPFAYRQVTRVTYQLPFKNIPAMDWLTSNANYTSGYQWDRGAQMDDGIEVGNQISNNLTLESTNRINLVSLYNKSSYLRKVNDRFDPRRRPQSPSQRQRELQANAREAEAKKFTQNITLRKDTTYTLNHNLNSKDIRVVAQKDGKPYSVKYKRLNNNSILITNKDSVNIQVNIQAKRKDPSEHSVFKEIGEYTARGLMSVRSLSFNYSRRQETHIAGFRPGIGDAFGQKNSDYGLVPGLGFAFGFDGGDNFIDRSLDRSWLVIDTMNINPAVYNQAQKFEFRAQIEPIKDLRIELNANWEENKRTEVQYMFEGTPRIFGGSFSMTTVAIGTSLRKSDPKKAYYSAAFEKFLKNRYIIQERLERKYEYTQYPSGGFMQGNVLGGEQYKSENGAVNPNAADVLIPAFIATYTGKDPDNVKLSAFPDLLSLLPNWAITYDGLINLPFIKERFKSLRLNHAYTCFYQVSNYNSFATWLQADNAEDGLGFIRDVLAGNPLPSSPYNIGSVGISELFNPLFGAEGVLNNNMSVNSQYNNGRMLVLNMSSYQIIESLQHEFIIGFGYRINEFNRVIGLNSKNSKNFNNDLNIKADISYKETQALLRSIQENFTQGTAGNTIVTLRFSADYTLSRALTLRAFFDRIMNTPLISATTYPTTNSNFGISLKFTLLQ